tara:strand:- start:525 stop:728 length:204 start_codon:yes stop_codon:yes gene_type:complete
MKKNPLAGIIILTIVISGILFLRTTIKTSNNEIAKDMLFVSDIFTTIRFILFIGIILFILGLAIKKR